MQHVIVHHVSYTPKEKKKLLKRSFRYGYLFLVLLKSFLSTMEESSIMMNLGLYVEMLTCIRICTTAAESPWSNGIVERHNDTLGFFVQKIMDDLKCDLSLAVAWALSAKNT